MTPPPIEPDHTAPADLHPFTHDKRDLEPDQLQTIREILVGNEIQNLEAHLDGRHATLRNELLSEFETLQGQTKSEIKDVGEMVVEMVGQLRIEDSAHAEGIEQIGHRLTDLERRVDDMHEKLSQQVRTVHDEFTRQMSEFSRVLESQREDLARQSISRTKFAKILNGLAGSLESDESALDAASEDAVDAA